MYTKTEPNTWQKVGFIIYLTGLITHWLDYPPFPEERHLLLMVAAFCVYSAGWVLGTQNKTPRAPLVLALACSAYGELAGFLLVLGLIGIIYLLALVALLIDRSTTKSKPKVSNKWQLIAMTSFFVDMLLLVVTNGNSIVVHIPFMIAFTVMYLAGWKKAYFEDQNQPASLWVLAACLLLGLYFFALPLLPIIPIFYAVMRERKKELQSSEHKNESANAEKR